MYIDLLQLYTQSINHSEIELLKFFISSIYGDSILNKLYTRSLFQDIDTITVDNETLFSQLSNNTLHYNKLLNVERFISKIPDYLPYFSNTFSNILNKESSISLHKKLFLGIIAASSLQSKFLYSELEREYLINEGNEEWLIHGLDVAEKKYAKYAKINNILLNQPWALKKGDIIEVYNPKDPSAKLSEFIEACLILTSYQRLASIISALHLSFDDNNIAKNENDTNYASNNNEEFFSKFISSYCAKYQDIGGKNNVFLSEIAYNWEDSGFYFLENYCKDLVRAINDEIVFLTEMNEHRTIEFYIGLILGMKNESYDYSLINKDKYTNITNKIFLKKIVSSPDTINLFELDLLRIKHSDDKILYLILLATVLRQKIQLTYLSKYLDEIVKE